MKNDLPIKNGIVIPEQELEITTSRAGGPGGQHVNKTDTRITIRWNVKNSTALSEKQKERVIENLGARLTEDGDFIINNSASRSQQQNKKMALSNLAQEIRKALHVPKKRIESTVSKAVKESRLRAKARRSTIKKIRSTKFENE
ncbi:MAG: alternative ribosome rescue aminoacyl-tRNA hydrolase ArfB [Hydrogenophaga sp.]|nr:alternative ribosome rescue aminoacyl-tRNA hydrolase ArfB [Hydrogenophaga sp.]